MSAPQPPGVKLPRVAQAAALLEVLAVLIGVLAWTLGQRVVSLQSGAPSAGSRTAEDGNLSEGAFESLARQLTESARRARAESAVPADPDALARRDKIALRMALPSTLAATQFPHIKYFRDAGIRRYAGPGTCLQCHGTLVVHGEQGERSTRDTLDDLMGSAHYRGAAALEGVPLYGFDGRRLPLSADTPDTLPLGEPPCGVPGGPPWEPWAIHATDSEAPGGGGRGLGCGQWHIGGGIRHPNLEEVRQGRAAQAAEDGIDCLICHAASYDMDRRRVITEEDQLRWGQDRSLAAALTVGRVGSGACQRCHAGQDHQGHPRPRYPDLNLSVTYEPARDAHAAAGLECTDCHIPRGHQIPRRPPAGTAGDGDEPRQDSACEGCHTRAPHASSSTSTLLNGHDARIACETCHLAPAPGGGLVLRDWVHPTWDPRLGLYQPTEIYPAAGPTRDFSVLWFNGASTLLGNALGDNPADAGTYDPFTHQLARIEDPALVASLRAAAQALSQSYPGIDPDAYARRAAEPLAQLGPQALNERRTLIDTRLRSLMRQGRSRLHPFQLANDLLPEDRTEAGPFGNRRAPFDARTYLETGDLEAALAKTGAGEGPAGTEPRWMPQMRTRTNSHGIGRRARACRDCHAPDGILDYRLLGYSDTRAAELQDLDDLMRLHQGSPTPWRQGPQRGSR